MVASLGQRTTLECPVIHCGEPIEVKWCKGDNCGAIIQNDNVDIMQTGVHNNRLVSSLIFKRISLEDAGFYRCYVNDGQTEEIGHAINVKVSGMLGLNSELEHYGVLILVLILASTTDSIELQHQSQRMTIQVKRSLTFSSPPASFSFLFFNAATFS